MAKEEHLAKLREGVEAWNNWRDEAIGVLPDLSEADLQLADLSGADLSSTRLHSAKLDGTNLSNAVLRDAILSGTGLGRAILYTADLQGALLRRSNLSRAKLTGAILCRADLLNANLSGANLREANLCRATFHRANLRGANLSGADLSGANLRSADLSGADLSGANLRHTHLRRTVFANTDLSSVTGLESCYHYSTSAIDHTTLERSGPLPLSFLRGCGLSDIFIDYIPSIFGHGIEFYSCFISHNSEDKQFARAIHDHLQGKGIRCWLDEKQILPGEDIYEEIDRGIKLWDQTILVCSENALKKSWWVDHEIKKTLRKEQQLMKERGKKTLAMVPITIDDFVFSDDYDAGIKSEILSRKVADLRQWKDRDSFEAGMEQVIQALRADENKKEEPPSPKL